MKEIKFNMEWKASILHVIQKRIPKFKIESQELLVKNKIMKPGKEILEL